VPDTSSWFPGVPINPIYEPGYDARTQTPFGGIITFVGSLVIAAVISGVTVGCGVGMGIVVVKVATELVVTGGTSDGPDMMFATITSPAIMGMMAMIRIPIAR
jgi:hypothetical protein